MDSGNDSYYEPISTDMLEYICDISQSHPNSEWKGALKATQNMGKVLHKLFKSVVKYISQNLLLGEYGSKGSHLIPEPRNFSEVTKFPDDIRNLC